MKEPIVLETVREWLEKRWIDKASIIYGHGQNVDFLVSERLCLPRFERPWIVNYEQVECKGTDSDVQRSIGQCLDYFRVDGRIPTYVAIPEDYRQYAILERMIEYFKLPFGILSISDERVISKRKDAKGKIRWFGLFKNENGDLTNRPP
jgi:hypothetical protein